MNQSEEEFTLLTEIALLSATPGAAPPVPDGRRSVDKGTPGGRNLTV